jgi:hypothetical protein
MTQAGKKFIVVSCNMMPIQHNIFTRARSFDAGKMLAQNSTQSAS